MQQDRSFRKQQRRILDEQAIGEGFEVGQYINAYASPFERSDIGVMFGGNALKSRWSRVFRSKPIDDRACWASHERPVEIENAHLAPFAPGRKRIRFGPLASVCKISLMAQAVGTSRQACRLQVRRKAGGHQAGVFANAVRRRPGKMRLFAGTRYKKRCASTPSTRSEAAEVQFRTG